MNSLQDLRGIAPHMFKSLVGKGHAEFSTNHQQDAQEFLLYLLDMIDKVQVSLNWFEIHIVVNITFEKLRLLFLGKFCEHSDNFVNICYP